MNTVLRIVVVIMLIGQSSCLLRSFQETPPEPVKPTQGYTSIGRLPFNEAWYGTYFQEDRIGYSHFKIEPSGDNYSISTDSLMRLKALKKTSEIGLKEKIMVHPDLTMISFESGVRMNDKNLDMTGKIEGKRLVVEMTVGGETVKREFPFEDKLYHSSAMSLIPALKGLKEGEVYSFSVFGSGNAFNPDERAIEKVEQNIMPVKNAPGPNGAVWSVKNNVGRSVIHSWLNKNGLTVLEKAQDGALITILEDESTARQFLEKKTAEGKDLILDVSLIPVSNPIKNSDKTRFLKVRMDGIDPSLIANDHRQQVTSKQEELKQKGFYVTVNVEEPGKPQIGGGTHSIPFLAHYLASTIVIQANHEEIVAQSGKIVSPRDSDLDQVNKLVRWTSENIKNEMKDSFTALSVLRSKEGECQSHANLYAAFARSRKIPTRVVTGIVYTQSKDYLGFLYHAWAESYVNGWLAVDPTLKQVPADATHIKIAGGDADDETSAVLKMLGKVKIEVLDYK